MKRVIKSSSGSHKLKRIARLGEFDNGKVIHNWQEMSDKEAEEQARQLSLDHPGEVYYVAYDDIMDPSSPYSYKFGHRVEELNRTKLQRMSEEEICTIECSTLPNWKIRSLIKKIQDDVYNAASDLMQTDYFGFELNDIAEYLFCDVEQVEDDMLRVELRAELTYNGMTELCQYCNAVVTKYDKSAYFDMVEPGIAEAYITIR